MFSAIEKEKDFHTRLKNDFVLAVAIQYSEYDVLRADDVLDIEDWGTLNDSDELKSHIQRKLDLLKERSVKQHEEADERRAVPAPTSVRPAHSGQKIQILY